MHLSPQGLTLTPSPRHPAAALRTHSTEAPSLGISARCARPCKVQPEAVLLDGGGTDVLTLTGGTVSWGSLEP